MKVRIRIRGRFFRLLTRLVLVSSAAICPAVAAEHSQSSITVGAMSSFPMNDTGLAILRQLYQPLGYSVTLAEYPATRSLSLASAGELDGELARIAGIEHDYPHLLPVPVPLLNLHLVAVNTQQALARTPLTSLNEYHLGAYLGAMVYQRLNLAPGHLEQPRTTQQLHQMLVSGRIDFAIVPDTLAQRWLQQRAQSGKTRLYLLNESLGEFPVYHYLHERHAALIPALTQALRQLANNGELARLLDEFIRHSDALTDTRTSAD
ncbi:substrate-binding periplasmic protein [Thalassolituus sp. LLYu03]|uniref:substrate-binding periplasmic protein n=1 Tax=Thalassolituus sp. LLYu03 TaxID=3421656 RepID=UPI003D2DCB92